jgi:mannose-6-phosphate isomerase-like protein (cupin superfamily)
MKITKISDMKTIKKGWGRASDGIAEVFVYHAGQETPETTIHIETVKLLHMAKGKRLSRHFHMDKSEYFICVAGAFRIELWDSDARDLSDPPARTFTLREGERMFVPATLQHRMSGLNQKNTLLEVSTKDADEDSYRIEKGD